MKRFFIAVLGTAVMFATAANALSLDATFDSPTYTPGATVQVTVTGVTFPK